MTRGLAVKVTPALLLWARPKWRFMSIGKKVVAFIEASLGSRCRTRETWRQACHSHTEFPELCCHLSRRTPFLYQCFQGIRSVWIMNRTEVNSISRGLPRSRGLVQEVCVACFPGSTAGEVCVETSVMQLRWAICCNTVTSWWARHSLPSPPCSSTQNQQCQIPTRSPPFANTMVKTWTLKFAISLSMNTDHLHNNREVRLEISQVINNDIEGAYYKLETNMQIGGRVQLQKLQHLLVCKGPPWSHLAFRHKHRNREGEFIVLQIIQKQAAQQPSCQRRLPLLPLHFHRVSVVMPQML